jgi:hypothetical protein
MPVSRPAFVMGGGEDEDAGVVDMKNESARENVKCGIPKSIFLLGKLIWVIEDAVSRAEEFVFEAGAQSGALTVVVVGRLEDFRTSVFVDDEQSHGSLG